MQPINSIRRWNRTVLALGALATAALWHPLANAQAQQDPAAPLGGGLLPPPPPETPEAEQTVHNLEQAERLDSGRGLSFAWLSVAPTFAYTGLSAIHDSALVDDALADSSAFGMGVSGTLGVRFLYLSLAARFRYLVADPYDDWTAGLLASLRIPLGPLEPYVSVGGGYLRAFGFKGEKQVYALGNKVNDLAIDGANVFVEGGLDYYVTPVFSIGASLEAALLFVGRERVVESNRSAFGRSGSGVGFGATGSVVLGLHL